MLITLIGQTSTQSLQRLHFFELMVIAPPKTSIAFCLQTFIHGASDGWQCIQNKVGVSTFVVC